MANRWIAGLLLALGCFAAACGGASEPPVQPSSGVESSGATITEADALSAAEAAATEQGLSLDGLTAKPANLFGEWQISYEPTGGGPLAGGFLVVLNDDTGELIDIVEYQ